MLTFSIFLEALTNKEKMNISQNRLADCFNTSASTINAWIKKDTRPRMDAPTICSYISRIPDETASCHNRSAFVERIIHFLDISQEEKDSLNAKYSEYRSLYPEDVCTKQFLTHLIQLALSREEFCKPLQYSPFDPLRPTVGIGVEHVIAALEDGRVLAAGADDYQQCCTNGWRDIVSVSAGWRSSVGLRADGTCIAVGRGTVGNGELFRWKNLRAVCCGTFHILGLKSDGTAVAYGVGGDGQCEVSEWKQIKALAAGTRHSVGLRGDGTVAACGSNSEGQCEVSDWKNVKQVAAAGEHTVALTEDGRILLAGEKFIYDFSGWKDVTAIATGLYHIVGLKKDGTILHTGSTAGGLDGVYKWWDIRAVFAGFYTTAGIRSDGSVVVTNDSHRRIRLNTAAWNVLGERRPRSSAPSPFEQTRKTLIPLLEDIHETALRLSACLHESPLGADGAKELEKIRKLSRDSWERRKQVLQIRPLADLILRYNAAFLDFCETFSTDEKTGLYRPSDSSCDACLAFLTAIRQILAELRSL